MKGKVHLCLLAAKRYKRRSPLRKNDQRGRGDLWNDAFSGELPEGCLSSRGRLKARVAFYGFYPLQGFPCILFWFTSIR